MNRRDLVKAVAAHTGLEARNIDDALKGFQDVVTAVVSKGEAVAISGFAKFAKVERAARMGRNPATGEPIRIKASKKVRVTPMKAFKDAVMNPSQAPKLARGIWPLEAAGTAKSPARKTAAKKAPARKATTARKTTTARKATPARKTTTARKATTARKTTTTARKARPTAKKAATRRR